MDGRLVAAKTRQRTAAGWRVRALCVWACLMMFAGVVTSAAVVSATAGQGVAKHRRAARKSRERRHEVTISFVRSGGFAGAATEVKGVAKLSDGGGAVSSADGYSRELTPEEAGQLRSLVSSKLAEKGTSAGAGSGADMYQYEINVMTPDGKSHKVAAVPETGMSGEDLAQWVKQESDRIWQHKLQKRNQSN